MEALLLFLAIDESSISQPQQLDKLIGQYHAAGEFRGVVLVAERGEVLLHKAYGMADRENSRPNTTTTRFLVGSFTKSLTAIAVLRLVEKDQMNLEQPISAYLRELVGKPVGAITVHQLLNMTSGLPPHLRRLTGVEKPMQPKEIVEVIAHTKPTFTPGTRYAYSNLNYHLLAVAASRVVGLSYPGLLQQEVFGPAGMTASKAERVGASPDLALGYRQREDGSWERAPRHSLSMALGSGDVTSTSGDLFRLDRTLASGKLLSKELRTRMFDGGSEAFGFYGYGWRIMPYKRSGERASGSLARHGGSMWGYLANVHRYLDDDYTIIVLANQRPCPIRQIHRDLKAILIGENPSRLEPAEGE